MTRDDDDILSSQHVWTEKYENCQFTQKITTGGFLNLGKFTSLQEYALRLTL